MGTIDKIKNTENISQILTKYFETQRGKNFVNALHTSSLLDLYTRFQVPKSCRSANIFHIYSVLYDMGIAERKYKEGGKYIYRIKNTIQHKPTVKIKYTYFNNLTKDELRKIWSRKPKKLGLAAKLHLYEEHKMERYEKRNKFPTETELKQDLFPEEIDITTNTSRYIYREYVRNFLSKVYCNTDRREKYYRVFGVYNNKNKMYEKEMDPIVIGYPCTSYNETTPISIVKDKIRERAASVKNRDSECVELKLYNKYGKLIASFICK